MTTGLAGISDHVKMAIFGQERGKLKSHLLVAILQDWDALRHNPHVIASPKTASNKEKLVGKSKLQKPLRFHPKTKEKEGGKEFCTHVLKN